jgi:AcrR family transcriptional regulator
MGKGGETHQAILERAVQVASREGLEGLTIGGLAFDLHLSKSGLFAHFRSKEALQVETIRFTAALFVDQVVRPALKAPRGEARVRAIFDRWLDWALADPTRGGCLFVAAAAEWDDREGPARDELVRQQTDWLDLIANVARTGIAEGEFRADTDPGQVAHDLLGVMLAYHHTGRLLRDPRAEERARRAFETLLASIRKPAAPRVADRRKS